MSSKQQKTESATDKNVADTADPTVDDDNKSDSEYEYEYEEIEVEVDDDYEADIVDKTGKVMISEVETIVPKDEKKLQETLVLKSDGTTEKLVQKVKSSRTTIHQEKHLKQEKHEKVEKRDKREVQQKQMKPEKQDKQEKEEKQETVELQENQEDNDKPKLGRPLTSQEESILLPLLQGLLAANGSDALSKVKPDKTPSDDKEPSNSKKNSRSNSMAENNEKNVSAKGPNILDELSTALNRLQTTLLEEKEVVTDTRKRNTILTLVAWLKRVLQTSTTDNAEAQLFSLSELLPTELLLTKLMPQLNKNNDNDDDGSQPNERSPASSKRFSRQRNNRFNTVGVSKEELADARLFLQEKLLSENLAVTASKSTIATKHQILDDNDDNRRKSLNLSYSNDLNKDIRTVFRESKKGSFSKSVDATSPEEATRKNVFPANQSDQTSVLPSAISRTEQVESQTKSVFRKKSLTSSNQYSASKDEETDSDDEDSKNPQRKSSNGSISSKSMNKFALRKLKMKRANTIDIPKDQTNDTNSDQGFSDGNKNSFNHETLGDIHQAIKSNCNTEVDKHHLPDFQVKSSGDKKFFAFLNKNSEENHTPWVNPHKTVLPVQQKVKAQNWSSKFGNLKNSFEHFEEHEQLPVSPQLSKKNNFTHAPTSPFKPVQSNKPPQIPNGIHHNQYNSQNVQHRVAAIQSHEKVLPVPDPAPKPQLRTYQSVPTYPPEQPQMYRDPSAQSKTSNWQQNKYASTDSYMQPSISPQISASAYNPLYVPVNKQVNQSPLSNSSYTSPIVNQMGPKPYAPPSPNEFPAYTFTSTDYTQPTSVSTFGPDQMTSPSAHNTTTSPVIKNTSPIIKNTILPDTSYLKTTTPPRTMPPPLHGSGRLNRQMKMVDVYNSNEYLSEPNYYRSPQPFSPTYDNYPTDGHDSRQSSQEFVATSQIMKYPPSQTATVVNKVSQRYDDEQQASNLRSFLTNVRSEKRQSNDYSEKSISPFSEPNFSHVNRSYVPPPPEPIRSKPNNCVSMENIATAKFTTPEPGAPIRLRNNTAYYGSHNALVSNNQFPNHVPQEFINNPLKTNKIDLKSIDKSKISAPVRLNSYGGQYIQPKVATNLDFSKPTYGKKPMNGTQTSSNVVKNNITNLNRSNTITHQRVANYEIKRKQSLPAQNSEYFDAEYEAENDSRAFNSNYLPFGALKKSKSTHTLALLQQFETKGKSTEEAPLPSYVKKPIFNAPDPKLKPTVEIQPKSIIKKTSQLEDYKPVQQAPIQQSAPIRPAAPIRPRTPPQSTPIHPKSPPLSAPIRSKVPDKLEPPSITETPSSPLVEDGHIIFPGQTTDTKRRVQHYAQTLNAMLNRKSIVLDDEVDVDVGDDKNDTGKGGLQRSKSGTLLTVPKQYESAIKKSEVLEKERTVAAYFAGNKSPQGLQRSSSQHSVLSSTSYKTVEEQKSNTVSPLHSSEIKDPHTPDSIESNSRTTTSIKSAHHMKILRKQQKQTSPNPLGKSQTLPSINLLDETNVDDAFDDLFASFVGKH